MMDAHLPWLAPDWQRQIQLVLNSYAQCVGTELIDRSGNAEEQAQRLFDAPFVVVSHGTQADPILNSANAIALRLWAMPREQFLETPSRLTAEPMHRDERERMLEQTRRKRYIDEYQGIRISSNGRRFRIDRATVWNVVDEQGQPAGQAATFTEWVFLD